MVVEVHIAMDGATVQASGLQPTEEPVPFFLEKALAGRVKIGPGLLGKPTDGILTEDSFKQLLPHHSRSTRNAYLQPCQTGSHGENHHHQRCAQPVHAEGEPPGLRALFLTLGADQFHESFLPGADGGRGLRVKARTGP